MPSTLRHQVPTVDLRSAVSFPAFFEKVKREPIYVILGVQGSGTNLLRKILVETFNISVVQDQAIVFNAAAELGMNPTPEAVRRQFDLVRSRLFPSALTRKTKRSVRGNASFEGIEQHFDAAQIRSAADFAMFVYGYGAYCRNTTFMAIKSDDLWEHIDQIDTVLPNRRIILLTRDFRDNFLSISKKDFGPIEPIVAARYVKERFAHYEAEYRRTEPSQRLHVRYEDLLREPDVFMADFRRQFLGGAASGTSAPVDKSRIRQNNMRKWASLDPQTLAHCESILGDELRTYGYPLESDGLAKPGPSTWLLATGRDTVKRIPQKIASVAKRLRK